MAVPSNEEKINIYQGIIEKIKKRLPTTNDKSVMYDIVIEELSKLPHFNWTGIYEYNESKEELNLHPNYVGLATEHTKIPKGKGVCGTAVAEDRDVVVEDVRELDNYIACSVNTRSELVVLIKGAENQILGQIDVDSDEVGAFSEVDRKYSAKIAALIGKNLERIPR